MDEWQMHLNDVYVSPGMGPTRKNIYLIVDVTNVGYETSTFTGYTLLVRDAQGRTYDSEHLGHWDCDELYGLETCAFVNPEEMCRTCVVYDLPLDARSFVATPMSIVSIWQGAFAFEVP